MTHQLHLEKKRYRQWVKAGLGLIYLKEGLVPFCEDLAKRQHKNILDNIKQTKNLSAVTCGHCSLDTLKPDHDVTKKANKYCILGQKSCCCRYPYGTYPCPNNVCGAIYDSIVKNHGSSPPKPNWKNTDIQKWCTDPWSIAKCFINTPGYEQKTSATDIDCTGLLHLIVNNIGYHEYIKCDLSDGSNVFSKVIRYRNDIFHSSSMELDKKTTTSYIQDMIAVLQDGNELRERQDAHYAVLKLQELMKEDFIVTTRNEADVVRAAVESINDTIQVFENKLKEKLENVPTRDDITSLDTRVTDLEFRMDTVEEEIDKFKRAQSSQKEQYHYVKSKLEFQKKTD